jgi:serine/threonine protein kinase/outer membrane protein assembly factor BamD (BamD/ComL family)
MSSRIEKYEIAGLIGEGGFGRVYKAQDTQMMRWVAIKVMSVEQNESALQRFRNEAIVAGGLHHPNLVTVYELGEYNNHPFIVMEYLEGRDLSCYIGNPNEQLPIAKKIDVLVQTARGLERAHRQQVIHRDIKPANIMLLKDGTVKVMDFGIARLTHDASRRNTATGMVVGSLLWMAPEIFSGHDADVPTDIWAFGVMAFELLSGEHPYQSPVLSSSSNTAQLIFQITQSEPPLLTTRAPEVPLTLSEVVRRCMARDRHDRYHSLRDVILDLEPILAQQRRQQATILAAQAEQAASLGQLDRAMDLVTEALESDNESQPARQLRERLQRELKRKSARDRVEMLIQQSSDDLAARRLEEAVQKLKTALDLDPDSRTARSRLDELQTLLARKRQVEQIAAKASSELSAGNLEGTGRLLEQAFSLEPNNSQLIQLQQSLVTERLRRERRQRFEAGLAQARERLEQHKPDEALRIISQTRDLATGEAGLDSLLFELEEIRRESERMESLRQAWNKAQTLQKKNDWQGIVSILEPIAISAEAAWPEITSLLANAQRELATRRRTEAMQAALDEAKALFKSGDINSALNSVERASILYPEDNRFRELSQRLTQERQRRESDRESSRVQEEVKDLLSRHRHSEALRRLDTAAERFPEASWGEQRRRVVLEYARNLQQSGNHEEAITVLTSTLEKHGADEVLARLKKEIEDDHETQRKRDSVFEAASRARSLIDSGELDAAINQVEKALESYPQEAVLVDLQRQTKERMRTREVDRRRRDFESRIAQVETSIALQDWDRATAVLEAIQKDFPGHADVAALRGKLAAARKRQQIIIRRTDVESAMKLQEWDRAQQLLFAFQRDYPDAESTSALSDAIQAGMRSVRMRIRFKAVENAIDARDWSGAAAGLHSLQNEFPNDESVSKLALRYEQELQLDQVVIHARQLIAAGDLTAARAEISKGLLVKRTPALEELYQQVDANIRERAPDPRLHSTPSSIALPPLQSKPEPEARKQSSPVMLVGGIAAAIVVLAGGYFVFRPKPVPLSIAPVSRIEAKAGESIQKQLKATGGTAPYKWTLASGSLPEGLQLSESTGDITGATEKSGDFHAEVKATDNAGQTATVGIDLKLEAIQQQAKVEKPPIITTPEIKTPPVENTRKPPDKNKKQPDTKKQDVVQKPIPDPPKPIVVETPKVELGEAEVARRATQVWTGTLAPGAIVTIDGSSASTGRVSGIPIPGQSAVQVTIQSPAGIVVSKQPSADSGWRSFQMRNDSGDAVSRVQFQWRRR